MTYHQFIQAVELRVKEEAPEKVRVAIHTARKNNGAYRKGILLSEQNVNISPTIYLEEYYKQFRQGMSVEKIAEEILALYQKIRFKKSWKEDPLSDYERIKERIVYRLVNYNANSMVLADTPHVRYLDLAIVFYVLLEVNGYGTASMMIENRHLKEWAMSKDRVYAQACKNTGYLLPYEFQTMRAVIEGITGEEESEESIDDEGIYVLSNNLRSYGAAVILYPGRLVQIGEYLQEDYYVLPSSVHETIIIPESMAPGKEMLSAMVEEINHTQVDAEEVLSDQAYFYDRVHKRLSL